MNNNKYSKIVVLFILAIGLNIQEVQAVEHSGLKLILKPKQKYVMRMTSKESISESSQGQVSKRVQEKIVEVVFHVEEVNSQGDILMKVTFGKLKIKNKSPGSTTEFDSTKPDAGPYHPLTAMYSALIGQSFKIRLASNGNILELQSIDDMILKMAEQVMAAEDKKMDKKTLRKLGTREKRREKIIKLLKMFYFGEEKIRPMMRAFIQVLPSGPVKPGDSWESGIDIEVLQRSEINLKNTLKSDENDKVIIDSAYKTNLDDKPIKDKKNPNMMFTRIAYKGTAQVGKSSGWIIRKEVKMIFSAEFRHQGRTRPISVNIIRIIEPVKSVISPD